MAQHLQKDCNIKLIEQDPDKCIDLADELEDTLIINGDGRNADLLIEEGIASMDAFVAVTGNSETNILSCLLAKKLGVKKTIAEVENMEYINLAENSGIDTLVNKKISAASRIFRHTTNPNVTQVKCMTGTSAEVLEYKVPHGAKITKGKLRDINFPKGAIVGGGTRGGKPFIATGDTTIEPDDRIVVFSMPQAFEKMSKFFL
ncbi:MAG: NAD-binding protein [Bacteroidales bacterium]